MPGTRKSTRESKAIASPKAKRPSPSAPVAPAEPAESEQWAPFACVTRERVESFASDVSDELEAIDREMEAEAALAANAETARREHTPEQLPRKSP